MYPKPFQKLIKNFSSLPSVGPKMAERLVLHLFKQEKEKLDDFAENLREMKNLKLCQMCFNIAEGEFCEICKNKKREQNMICVVEEPLDIISIEKTGVYNGLYFVLGGVILTDANGSEKLKINEILNRLEKEQIQEVIIATNPTVEGDATAFYLKQKIKPLNVKITRLGRGLSAGGDIEYTDEITLSESLTNRKELV